LPAWFYPPVRDSLRAAGQRVAYAVLRAPLPLCLERVRTRVEQPAEAAVVEHVWNQFADLGPLERHAIDTDTLGPGETAQLLAERLDLLA
jgi:hypothetical protein